MEKIEIHKLTNYSLVKLRDDVFKVNDVLNYGELKDFLLSVQRDIDAEIIDRWLKSDQNQGEGICHEDNEDE